MSEVKNFETRVSFVVPAIKLALILFIIIFLSWLLYTPAAVALFFKVKMTLEFERLQRDMPHLVTLSQTEDGQSVFSVDEETLWRGSTVPKGVGYNLGMGGVSLRDPSQPFSMKGIPKIDLADNSLAINTAILYQVTLSKAPVLKVVNTSLFVPFQSEASVAHPEIYVDIVGLRHVALDYGRQVFFIKLVSSTWAGALTMLFVTRALYLVMLRYVSGKDTAPKEAQGKLFRRGALRRLIKKNEDIDTDNIHLAALGKQLSFFAHDVRNILSSLRLNAEILQSRENTQEAAIGLNLDRTVERCIGMLEWAIAFTSDKGLEISKQPYLLKSIIEEAFDFTQQNPLAPTVALRIDCPNRFWVMTDRDKLFRVIYNLIFNSTRALLVAPHPHEIHISVEERNNQCRIRLSDSAAGIHVPEGLIAEGGSIELSVLMQKGSSQSTGLGLRIASDFMLALGGSLTLNRDASGVIAFLIDFPNDIDNRKFHL
jgi:signal transduction histidine kinase